MALKENLQKALTELRKEKERKFDQSVDLIINLQKFNLKKTPINLFVSVPNKIKDKKIGAFLESKSDYIETITKEEFKKYSNKAALKKIVNKFDFFIAQASLMPKVASTFGRFLGPMGKMPSPQMGIILNPDEKTIEALKTKINNSVKLKIKESSLKLSVGKASMEDSKIIDNSITIYDAFLKTLPRGIENIKNVGLKFTMSKPQRINVK